MELYGTPRSHSANLPPYESFNYFQDDIYGSHVTSASRTEKQYEDYAKDYSVRRVYSAAGGGVWGERVNEWERKRKISAGGL